MCMLCKFLLVLCHVRVRNKVKTDFFKNKINSISYSIKKLDNEQVVNLLSSNWCILNIKDYTRKYAINPLFIFRQTDASYSMLCHGTAIYFSTLVICLETSGN